MSTIRHAGLLAWLHLARSYHKIQRHEVEHLAKYDLTLAQFDVLAHLFVMQGITQQALAEKLLVTKGNVCGLIDRLSSRDLVRRCDDPQDRRSNLLHLTDAGHALAAQVIPAHERFLMELWSGISDEEQENLLIGLRRLDRSLGAE